MTTPAFRRHARPAAIVIALLGLTAFAMSRLAPKPLKVGNLAPSFRATSLSTGRPVSVPDITHGHLTFLSFWVRSCKLCPMQFTELDSLAHTYGPRGLVIVAVSIDPVGSASARDSLRAKEA